VGSAYAALDATAAVLAARAQTAAGKLTTSAASTYAPKRSLVNGYPS